MTILTKPSEKKAEKTPAAGVGDDVAMLQGGVATAPRMLPTRNHSQECDAESMDFQHPTNPCMKTFVAFAIFVLIMFLGVMAGYTLYSIYSPGSSNRYLARFDIPYNADELQLPRIDFRSDDLEFDRILQLAHQPIDEDILPMRSNYFRENIELDTSDSEAYAKIDVPDFKDGRRGRFMHDFKENQSAIIDTTANRCFIMAMDRETTLPPKSFLDLMLKMSNGYYNIDTDRVRKNMRVVMPPITDLSLISERIGNECYDMKVYMLEKFTSGVFKREAVALPDTGKFAEFSGNKIVEFNLVNIAAIDEYEKKAQQ